MQVYLERQDARPGAGGQRGRAPGSSNWEAVARLLSRKHDRIDSLHALDLLPGEVCAAGHPRVISGSDISLLIYSPSTARSQGARSSAGARPILH